MIEELYTAYYEELRKYFVKQAYGYANAEDIVQETFVKAIEYEKTLGKLDDHKRRAWLYRTAKNLLIDRIRHKKREPEWEMKTDGEDMSSIEVDMMLGLLKDQDRSIFILRHYEGYRATEIADIFQMTPANVRTRLSLARKILKMELER
ncbi:MAG: RNA polymerase sigma factor [Lachnospiraceae bacterium]|jgi:RNA polymerase sigma-70 factor (ECF subfamily)|nr:RNA polymerase sigma factor [Lachnospiraceae bacterium]